MSSLLSAKGPSVTLNLPPANRTFVPVSGRTKPPVITNTPDFCISCVKRPISAICSGVVTAPGSFW